MQESTRKSLETIKSVLDNQRLTRAEHDLLQGAFGEVVTTIAILEKQVEDLLEKQPERLSTSGVQVQAAPKKPKRKPSKVVDVVMVDGTGDN